MKVEGPPKPFDRLDRRCGRLGEFVENLGDRLDTAFRRARWATALD